MSDQLVERVIRAVGRVVGPAVLPVQLHEPLLDGNEKRYLAECVETGWVSSVGPFVDRFERELAGYTGAAAAVCVVNGTAALHLALLLAGVRQGDEVLLPALTFVATANAVAYCGAVPHFCDSEETTLGLDPAKLADYLAAISSPGEDGPVNLRTGRRIKAVVPMHTFGHPVDLEPLIGLCREYRIELIEDAAESLGSLYKGRHTGTFGQLAALSFNGNKIVTCGGGGAILTSDPELAARARHLSTTARIKHQWEFRHDRTGFNYRMPNVNAALGCAQLERIETFLASKRALAERYRREFENIPGVRFFAETGFARSNYWLNTIVLAEENAGLRDSLLAGLHEQGFLARPVWVPMHCLEMYRDCPAMELDTVNSLSGRIINLPSSAGLSGEQTHQR